MPTSSFDTFFACTIILAAALIATGYVCSTMQVRIDNTQSINEQSYLQSIANYIVTNPGSPTNWGTNGSIPTDFGLATNQSTVPYQVDIDKITLLNSLNSYSLSYLDILNSAKLSNIALGIAVSQIMDITIQSTGNSTNGDVTSFTFSVSTAINAEPVSATLSCYTIADSYQNNITAVTSAVGSGTFAVQVPNSAGDNALVVVFARANFDDQITSYAVYNLENSSQETTPSSGDLTLSPLNYQLNLSTNSSALTVQNGYVLTYGTEQNLPASTSAMQYPIPQVVDKSPYIIVVCGLDNGEYFQQWVSYPQVPFNAGATLSDSQQNVFTYTVTINGVLYQLELTLGGIAS